MKLLRTFALAFAIFTPAIAAASPAMPACCRGAACCPGCPFCHHAA